MVEVAAAGVVLPARRLRRRASRWRLLTLRAVADDWSRLPPGAGPAVAVCCSGVCRSAAPCPTTGPPNRLRAAVLYKCSAALHVLMVA